MLKPQVGPLYVRRNFQLVVFRSYWQTSWPFFFFCKKAGRIQQITDWRASPSRSNGYSEFFSQQPHLMSSNSPSGGMKLILLSESNLLSLTHWWKVQSSMAMDCFPLGHRRIKISAKSCSNGIQAPLTANSRRSHMLWLSHRRYSK